MTKTRYRWKWTAAIERGTLEVLQRLAGELGFFVNRPGGKFGMESPTAMLDSLAAAYGRDPEAVANALRQVGVVNPSPDPS